MSMHEIPLSTLEEMGLRRHGLTVGSPSQLSDVFRQGVAWVLSQQAAQPVPPIDMVLHCPKCGLRHVDEAEGEGDDEATTQRLDVWRNPPHRSHLCHGCGHIWRPADVPTNGVAAIKTHGTNDSAIAQPQQATDWRQATTYLQRMSHALSLLCGVTPTDEMIAAYLDTSRDDDRLQHWCADNGPAWAQGIVVIDAARVLADTPAEGADHESAQPQQPAQPVAWRYEDARGHFRYRGYVPNFDVEYAILRPIPLYANAQPQQKPGIPQ